MSDEAAVALWDDDMDAYEAIEEIDRRFLLGLPKDLRHWFTVADLWSAIVQKHLSAGERDGACHSAMAFYRLRAAGAVFDGKRSGPGARLARRQGASWSAHLRALGESTGLRMPEAQISAYGCLAVFAIPVAAVASRPWLLGPATGWTLAGLALLIALGAPRVLSKQTMTLAGLSQSVASMNPIALAARGGRLREDELWQRMASVLAETSGIRADRIVLGTRFFAKPKR